MASAYLKWKSRGLETAGIYKPEFFRLLVADDKKRFEELIEAPGTTLHDELYDQLKELLKSRNPKATLSAEDIEQRINNHLAGGGMDDYGVWVYYPWSGRVVHILDEDEYIELRTAANKNKITIAERNILATKKVGVIGLSVGQSVSVTLALERGCGELRLADFDTLELNNLNRIRTGVHNLGILKAYLVAREIAEIDPYFKVVCYTEGVTDDNVDNFFLDGGKLDAVIDECDGINIKILCRIKARELDVPVLMEASDRGTLDVERFDLHPGMPIMHGWLEHLTLDLDVLRNLKTNEEKIPYILPISGLDTLSSKMKASMVEMRNTLTTWPQLATAVTLGGALTADTCRRIFLGQFTDSGRYFIDLEQIVPDTRAKKEFAPEIALPPFTEGEMSVLASTALAALPSPGHLPGVDDITELVSAAIKAPSAGNAQPWLWHYKAGYLFLFYQHTDTVPFSDFQQMSSYLAYGAAIANIELTANVKGMATEVQLLPVANEKRLVAAIKFNKLTSTVDDIKAGLASYIDTRITDRSRTAGGVIAQSAIDELTASVMMVPGANLFIKTDKASIDALGGIAGPVERLKMLHPATHHDFYKKELKHSAGENIIVDGIDIASLHLSQAEDILVKMVKDPAVPQLLTDWKGGQALEYLARIPLMSASGIGLITVPSYSPADLIAGGKAMERMWLSATKNGLSIHPVMMPLYFFARQQHGKGEGIPGFMEDELVALYDQFRVLFPEVNYSEAVFLFRLGTAGEKQQISNRKSIESVFSIS